MYVNSRWNLVCRTASVFFLIFAASTQPWPWPWPGPADHILSGDDKYRQDMCPDSCNNAALRIPIGNEQAFYHCHAVDLWPNESLIEILQIYQPGKGIRFYCQRNPFLFSELFLWNEIGKNPICLLTIARKRPSEPRLLQEAENLHVPSPSRRRLLQP